VYYVKNNGLERQVNRGQMWALRRSYFLGRVNWRFFWKIKVEWSATYIFTTTPGQHFPEVNGQISVSVDSAASLSCCLPNHPSPDVGLWLWGRDIGGGLGNWQIRSVGQSRGSLKEIQKKWDWWDGCTALSNMLLLPSPFYLPSLLHLSEPLLRIKTCWPNLTTLHFSAHWLQAAAQKQQAIETTPEMALKAIKLLTWYLHWVVRW
jgi:hypothetical protein